MAPRVNEHRLPMTFLRRKRLWAVDDNQFWSKVVPQEAVPSLPFWLPPATDTHPSIAVIRTLHRRKLSWFVQEHNLQDGEEVSPTSDDHRAEIRERGCQDIYCCRYRSFILPKASCNRRIPNNQKMHFESIVQEVFTALSAEIGQPKFDQVRKFLPREAETLCHSELS